jgi:HEPN domain-containing protein
MREEKAISSKDRAKITHEIIKFTRPFLQHKKLLFNSINFRNLLDCVELLGGEILKETDDEIIKQWIFFSECDLRASQRLYRAEHGLTLYHLQQCVEKLAKATIMFYGLKTEKEIIQYNHKPQKFIFDMLENNIINKVLGEKYPFIHVSKPKMIEEKKLKKLKHNINDKEKMIEEGDAFVLYVKNLIDKGHPFLASANHWKGQMTNIYEETIPLKERKRMEAKLSLDGYPLEEQFKNMSHIYWLYTNFLYIILPLNISLWVFESTTRYPDQRRLLKTEFNDLRVYEHFNILTMKLQDYIDNFKIMFV